MFGLPKKPEKSGNMAKDRLKMILVTDRLDNSNNMLELMRQDILKVVKNYLDIDESDFDLQICQQVEDSGDETPTLKAEIPIKSMRKRR